MSFFRRAAAGLRYFPERLLHPTRRRRILTLLARRGSPGSILFVCNGNICRSPFAAGLAGKLLPSSVRVTSAGFIGPGRATPDAAVAAARRHGVPLETHRSRVLTQAELDSADLVVVMDLRQQRQIARSRPSVADRVVLLGDLDPVPIERRAIRDPVEQDDEVYRASYARIDRCVRALARALKAAQ